MLLPLTRVRNPTLKDELDVKSLGDKYSFGFRSTPLAMRDILLPPALVPVGKISSHIRCARGRRRFNTTYCGVDRRRRFEASGGWRHLPIPRDWLPGGPFGRGRREQKMSKSLATPFSSRQHGANQEEVAQIYTGRMDMNAPATRTMRSFNTCRPSSPTRARWPSSRIATGGDASATGTSKPN